MTENYDTLSQAIADLQEKGYDQDLNVKSNCIECKALNYEILAEEFEVDEMHRFEGYTSPDDSSILFAISSDKYNLKGLLVDAYGVYADPMTTKMIKKLQYKP
ncbi:phosphoribosylpyrophosphate synthetase [Aquimarina sp. SS2-1]|uniref:phosphoribosylpyrophosphate synthetase n=1 Tax=Aquimarina besae TaxID=3342247 RepID=UPI00366B2A31